MHQAPQAWRQLQPCAPHSHGTDEESPSRSRLPSEQNRTTPHPVFSTTHARLSCFGNVGPDFSFRQQAQNNRIDCLDLYTLMQETSCDHFAIAAQTVTNRFHYNYGDHDIVVPGCIRDVEECRKTSNTSPGNMYKRAQQRHIPLGVQVQYNPGPLRPCTRIRGLAMPPRAPAKGRRRSVGGW